MIKQDLYRHHYLPVIEKVIFTESLACITCSARGCSSCMCSGEAPSCAMSTPQEKEYYKVARSVNPVSGTNWEGTGVRPDVAVEADRAYDVALAAALRAVRDRPPVGDLDRDVREEAVRALADLGHAG